MKYMFGYQNEVGQIYDLELTCNHVCFGYSWVFKVSNRLTANITFQEIYFSSGPYLCDEGHLDLMYAKKSIMPMKIYLYHQLKTLNPAQMQGGGFIRDTV